MQHIMGSRVKLAEHVRNFWHVTTPEDVAVEDIVKPEFWSHVTRQLKPLDRIEVVAETGTFFADLLVERVSTTGVHVTLLNAVQRDAAPSETGADLEGYSIEWKGPHTKFAVIRKSDGAKLKDGLAPKSTAIRWAQDHAKAMVA